ncbi:MAG: CHAP domain-containing protein [Deltaproteobacteria bacterium]|nr:CHAP domain-containing protein [Deltaproteobacteria bacterium]
MMAPLLRRCALCALVVAGAACAPQSAALRPSHPLLGDAAGTSDLAVPRGLRAPIFDDSKPRDDAETAAARVRIADAAARSVGKGPLVVGGQRYRMDCSGVAHAIYARAGFPLGPVGDTRGLFALAQARGSMRRSEPLPGDLAFFDFTWDADGNGAFDDPLSHVAVVERVDDDGTVILVHRVGDRVVRARMNLARPHDRHDERGASLNHFLRSAAGAHPAKTTAELFVAFGSLPLEARPAIARR